MPQYTLTYFPISGRAQPARLMFEVAGIEYKDIRIPFTEWPATKTDAARFPLTQMPTLQVDDEMICQSSAIYRYLANSFGFYGESIKDKADIDQICETFKDYLEEAKKSVLNQSLNDEEKKAKYAEHFASDGCKRKLEFITKILKKHNNGEKFFVGEKISLADFVFVAQNSMMEAYPTWLDSYPELKALLARIQSVEVVKKHLEANK